MRNEYDNYSPMRTISGTGVLHLVRSIFEDIPSANELPIYEASPTVGPQPMVDSSFLHSIVNTITPWLPLASPPIRIVRESIATGTISWTVVLSLRTQKILFGRSEWLLSSVQADSSHGGGVGMKENTSRIQNSMAGFSVYLALENQSAWQIRKKTTLHFVPDFSFIAYPSSLAKRETLQT